MRSTFLVVYEDGNQCKILATDEIEAAELRMEQIWSNGDVDSVQDMDFTVTDPEGKVYEVNVSIDFEPTFMGSSLTKMRELCNQMEETGDHV